MSQRALDHRQEIPLDAATKDCVECGKEFVPKTPERVVCGPRCAGARGVLKRVYAKPKDRKGWK